MTYNPNIPQAGDLISISQGDLLTNFQQIDIKYGTSGDHYAFSNTSAAEQNRHAKVTLPALPTATAPGNAIPTPAAGEGAIFATSLTSGAPPITTTYPFWKRDGIATPYPMAANKAYATFILRNSNGVATLVDSFNITSITRTALGTYTVQLLTALPFQSGVKEYSILFGLGGPAAAATIVTMATYESTTSNSFVIKLTSSAGSNDLTGNRLSFNVIQTDQ